jgi:phage tail-like protein
MATGGTKQHQDNYVTANRFYVEIEGVATAAFNECSSFSVKIPTEIFHEGGVNDHQRVLLGQPEYSEITLNRGVTDDFTFWEWITDVIAKPNQRRNINIVTFNQAGEIIQTWTLIGSVPVAWTAPPLQADSTVVAIEELTLAYEGLEFSRLTGSGGAVYLASGRGEDGYYIGEQSG